MTVEYEESFGVIPLKHNGEEWQVFVILHKHGEHWGFPKGKADEGEDPQVSAFRELKEETNLTVEKLLQENPISEQYTFFRDGNKVQKTVHYFPAIVSGAFLLQPEEIRDGKWLAIDAAKNQLTFEEARTVCEKMKDLLSKSEH